jgi:hypothetical protein
MELFPGNRDRSPCFQVCHAASNFLVPGPLHGVTRGIKTIRQCVRQSSALIRREGKRLPQEMGNLFAHVDSLTTGKGKQPDERGWTSGVNTPKTRAPEARQAVRHVDEG